MRILVACECSGVVRRAFRARGHDAWSCDILPATDGGEHIHGDVRGVLRWGWDALIAFPPCTYLCGSGLHWIARGRIEADGRPRKAHFEEAVAFVRLLLGADIHYIALENPVGAIGTQIRKPDQSIQPYEFGEDASKRTCLWLKNLPPLRPTKHIQGRIVNGRERWANQTDSGQNKLPPSDLRGHLRAVTYPGIAHAMAEQWDFARPDQLQLIA